MVDRRKMLIDEIPRLQRELAILQRQWDRRFWLALFGIATVPAYFLFGKVVAIATLLSTPILVATQSYLLWVRRSECVQLIEETKRELAALGSPSREAAESVGRLESNQFDAT